MRVQFRIPRFASALADVVLETKSALRAEEFVKSAASMTLAKCGVRMLAYRSQIRSQMGWLAVMDIVCLAAGCAIASIVRFAPEEWGQYVVNHLDGWLILVASVVIANYLAGGYRLQAVYSRFNLVVTWLFSLGFATVILSVTSYGWFRLLLGRGVLFLSLVSYSVFSLSLKLFVYRMLFRSEWFVRRYAVLGTREEGREIRRIVESPWVLPVHRVVAYLAVGSDEKPDGAPGGMLDGVPVLSLRGADVEALVKGLGIDLLVIAGTHAELAGENLLYLRRLRFSGIEILPGSAAIEVYCGRTPIEMVNDVYVTELALISEGPGIEQWKRLTDIIVSLVMLVLLAPVLLIIVLAIKMDEPGAPVCYEQERVGRFGRLFRVRKFRTMRVDAEAATGPVWAAADDPRVTRIGRFLRRFRLDEIPQFLNILRGEMSLVGPRPERPEIAAELESRIPFFRERENVMPGLTGWAQIRHPYANTEEDSIRKLEYDLYYIKHMSLALDLQIILSTLRTVVMGKPSEGL